MTNSKLMIVDIFMKITLKKNLVRSVRSFYIFSDTSISGLIDS